MMTIAEKIGARYAMISSGIISFLVLGYQFFLENSEDLFPVLGGVVVFLIASFYVGKWAGRMIDKDHKSWLIGYSTTVVSSSAVILGFIIYSILDQPMDIAGILGLALFSFFIMLIWGLIPMLLVGSLYGYLVKKAIAEPNINNIDLDS